MNFQRLNESLLLEDSTTFTMRLARRCISTGRRTSDAEEREKKLYRFSFKKTNWHIFDFELRAILSVARDRHTFSRLGQLAYSELSQSLVVRRKHSVESPSASTIISIQIDANLKEATLTVARRENRRNAERKRKEHREGKRMREKERERGRHNKRRLKYIDEVYVSPNVLLSQWQGPEASPKFEKLMVLVSFGERYSKQKEGGWMQIRFK